MRWLAELCDQKKFPYAGVSKLQDGMFNLHYSADINAKFPGTSICPNFKGIFVINLGWHIVEKYSLVTRRN